MPKSSFVLSGQGGGDRNTGGGIDTFSGMRNPDGNLRTDLRQQDYDSLELLTMSFYDATESLAQAAPRTRNLTLYRGICIPQIGAEASQTEIEETVSKYSDAIPSSASWNMETPQRFSTGEGQDGVIFYMIVPPDFPLVMLSYPDESNEGEPRALDIPGQKEVLVGASSFSDVHLLKMEEQEGRRCYHVQVTLRAVPLEKVVDRIDEAREAAKPAVAPAPETTNRMRITPSNVLPMFGIPAGNMKVGEIYEYKEQQGNKYRCTECGSLIFCFERVDESGE